MTLLLWRFSWFKENNNKKTKQSICLCAPVNRMAAVIPDRMRRRSQRHRAGALQLSLWNLRGGKLNCLFQLCCYSATAPPLLSRSNFNLFLLTPKCVFQILLGIWSQKSHILITQDYVTHHLQWVFNLRKLKQCFLYHRDLIMKDNNCVKNILLKKFEAHFENT